MWFEKPYIMVGLLSMHFEERLINTLAIELRQPHEEQFFLRAGRIVRAGTAVS